MLVADVHYVDQRAAAKVAALVACWNIERFGVPRRPCVRRVVRAVERHLGRGVPVSSRACERLVRRAELRLGVWEPEDDWRQGIDAKRALAMLALGEAALCLAEARFASDRVLTPLVLSTEGDGATDPLQSLTRRLRSQPWPRTRPSPTDLAAGSAQLRVAWDVVCDALDEPFSVGSLGSCADRAEHLGLDPALPLERAIVECSSTSRRFEQVDQILHGTGS